MIDHDGIIENIDRDVAHVKIDSQSACSACHAKGVCGTADQEEKFLDVPLHGVSYKAGEMVRVLVEKRMGFKAVALGYFYPFLLLMAVLILALVSGIGEMKAGLLSLLSLIPYYLGLYLARKRIESSFTFSIQKI